MALKLCCDGCDCDVTQDAAQARGQLERLFYCAACAVVADRLEADLDRERAKLARQFEAFRAERLTEARKALKRIPDE